jgi:hypothetical protein
MKRWAPLLCLVSLLAHAQYILPVPAGFSYSSSPPGSVPAPAAAVGYNTQTFNSTTIGTTAGNWIDWNFFGTGSHTNITQNGDGSITIAGDGSNNYNASLATAALTSGTSWKGTAFGGGGYLEATFTITGTPSGSAQTPSFWAGDIETTSGQSPQTSGNQWPEVDDIEANSAGTTQYGIAFHNWYNNGGANTAANCSVGSPATGVNLNASNQFGWLWVPATGSTQGYVKYYLNRTQVGTTCFYNQYTGSPFPPSGSQVGAIIDQRHMMMILGNSSGSGTSMNITSVQVWQASGANNLVH